MDKNIDKERAIQLLVGFRNYLTSGNPIWDINDVSKAFDIAIEALKNECMNVQCADMRGDYDEKPM